MNEAHKKYDVHPLIRLFHMRKMTEIEGMNWLQDRGLVSDICVWARDVAPVDVARVEALFAARWNYGERVTETITGTFDALPVGM